MSKPPANPGEPSPRGSKRTYSRADHRARSHESAHAEFDAAGEAPQIDAHPLVPGGAGELVTSDAQLTELIGHLQSAGSFAYDSEFIGEMTYFPKLCVIQVASSQRVALIDPLASIDLRPFWELLADGSVEKIVHAGQQDIEPVVRHLGRGPVNIFDTQLAAGLAALPYPVSLSKLVFELAGAKLGKGLTFTHWDQRPLSSMQLRYAADDVRYLPRVRAELGRRLAALGHVEWAREECAAQCNPALYGFNPEVQYLRVKGASNLEPRNLAVLRALVNWRNGAAREANVPPRSYLRDEILLDMARTPIKSVDRLERVKGLPRPVEAAHGATLVEVTQAALATPASQLPPGGREVEPLPSEKFRADAFTAAAQATCAAQGIDPALVASKQDLAEFWQAIQGGKPDANQLMIGWRREAIGEPLLNLTRGSDHVTLSWRDDALRMT